MSLSRSRIQEISAIAQDLLRESTADLANMVPPVSITPILQKYDLKLFQGSFEDPSILGMYDKQQKSIVVDEKAIFPRKLFTIAHELGHFILHRDKLQDVYHRRDVFDLSDNHEHQQELEANCFAASLLMPEPLIRKLWGMLRDRKAMADVFQVSNSAMLWRLTELNLIGHGD